MFRASGKVFAIKMLSKSLVIKSKQVDTFSRAPHSSRR